MCGETYCECYSEGSEYTKGEITETDFKAGVEFAQSVTAKKEYKTKSCLATSKKTNTMKTRKTRHKKLMNKYYTFNFIVFLMIVCGVFWFVAKIFK